MLLGALIGMNLMTGIGAYMHPQQVCEPCAHAAFIVHAVLAYSPVTDVGPMMMRRMAPTTLGITVLLTKGRAMALTARAGAGARRAEEGAYRGLSLGRGRGKC